MCWHEWSKWQDVDKNGGELMQEKRCAKCNKAKRRITGPYS